MRKRSSTNTKPLTEEQLNELKANACNVLCDVRKTLLQRFPFVGAIAMNLDLVPTRDLDNPTAATDGAAMYFDIAFLSELKPEERLFVFAHEIYHNVLMHSLRLETRDQYTFNVASDIEVNQLLEKDGLVAPKDGCFIKTRNHPNGYPFNEGLSAEEYYELLLKNQQHQQNQSNRAENGQSGSGNPDGKLEGQFDRHMQKDEDRSEELSKERNESDKYGKVGHDPDFRPNVTEGNVEHIREAAVAAAQMIERQCGKLPDHIKQIVNKLTEPAVDWRECLAQFCTRTNGDTRTWNKCNRRFVHSGTYLPSTKGEKLNVCVGIDTSGSVSQVLSKFLGELNGICNAFEYDLHVIQCDTEVQHVDHYDNENQLDLENTKFEVHGFGGTRLTPIFRYIEDNNLECDCCVMLTDGEFDTLDSTDTPNFPVMWCVTENGRTDAITFGEICNLQK